MKDNQRRAMFANMNQERPTTTNVSPFTKVSSINYLHNRSGEKIQNEFISKNNSEKNKKVRTKSLIPSRDEKNSFNVFVDSSRRQDGKRYSSVTVVEYQPDGTAISIRGLGGLPLTKEQAQQVKKDVVKQLKQKVDIEVLSNSYKQKLPYNPLAWDNWSSNQQRSAEVMRQNQRKTFQLNTTTDYTKAERFKSRLENKGYDVTTTNYGLNGVTITGNKK